MKNKLLLCVFVLIAKFSWSQCCPYVATPTVIPANPTVNDVVKIIVSVTTPNQGTKLSITTNTTLPNRISIVGCYWDGMLTALKTFVDTLSFGPLTQGSWSVSFVGMSSSSNHHCVMVDSHEVHNTFNVTIATELNRNTADPLPEIFPNPASEKLFLTGTGKIKTVRIINIAGSDIREAVVQNLSVDISALSEGVYILELSDGAVTRRIKFVKQ